MYETLKGYEKFNNIIENFFAELGYDEISCRLEDEFAYYYGIDIISYTLLEYPLCDIAFRQYLKATYPFMPECSMFIFSLLHELGHHLTLDNISKKRYRKCKKSKKILEKRKIKTEKEAIQQQLDYCRLYDEKIATKKAVEILIENYDYILHFETILFEAINEFYNNNLVTA